VEELRSALRLIDPDGGEWHAELVKRWVASEDPPYFLPFQVLLALTVVSSRIREATDGWLSGLAAEERAEFQRERALWECVSKGEITSPGWQGGQDE
jgi:hypothetical protein